MFKMFLHSLVYKEKIYMGTFMIYQLMYLVLEKLIKNNSNESMQSYLKAFLNSIYTKGSHEFSPSTIYGLASSK